MTFQEQFDDRKQRYDAYMTEGKRLDDEYKLKAAELFRKAYPKRKKVDYDLLPTLPGASELRSVYTALLETLVSEHRADDAKCDEQLNLLAMTESPRITEELTHVYTSHSSTYRSSGGSEYAEKAAKLNAALVESHGLTAEVRPVGDRKQYDFTVYQDYGLFVNTDLIGWEIIKRRPGLTTKEWLKRCLKLGANPRVYNPFLPHGLEAKLGLDYFGNEIG